jgi:hypothetical protein
LKTQAFILVSLAFLIGCSKPPRESTLPIELPVELDSFGTNVCPLEGVSIQKSADGLERAIAIQQDWLGDKYGSLRLICEASSVERLLEFVANGPGKEFDETTGTEFLPKGTYRYLFQGKTWNDHSALSNDVIYATSETFGLTLNITHNNGREVLVVGLKQKALPDAAPKPAFAGHFIWTNK